jgi:hypothetical protein
MVKYHPFATNPTHHVAPAWIVRRMFVHVPISSPVAAIVHVTKLGAFTSPSRCPPFTVMETTPDIAIDPVILSSAVDVATQ